MKGATPEGWIGRPVLPVEDIDGGLYLTSVRVHTVTECATPASWERPPPAPVVQYYVSAEDFMVVQKERDTLRRACALVGAESVEGRDWTVVERLLANVGLTHADHDAMRDLVRWARTAPALSSPRETAGE